jgi:DnaK suppressor protein
MITDHPSLDKAFIAKQRIRLLAERTRLSRSLERGEQEDRSIAGAAAGQANETEDLAQDLMIAENNRVLGGSLADQQNAIDRALAKIDEGTYGFSDDSGEPIALSRLHACPEAIRTIAEEAVILEHSRTTARTL